jgi:hypothetical protein
MDLYAHVRIMVGVVLLGLPNCCAAWHGSFSTPRKSDSIGFI